MLDSQACTDLRGITYFRWQIELWPNIDMGRATGVRMCQHCHCGELWRFMFCRLCVSAVTTGWTFVQMLKFKIKRKNFIDCILFQCWLSRPRMPEPFISKVASVVADPTAWNFPRRGCVVNMCRPSAGITHDAVAGFGSKAAKGARKLYHLIGG